MSFVLVRARGRALAFALDDVLEVVRTVAVREPVLSRWRGRFGRIDWRGTLVPACELAVRLERARPRPIAEYVDGHVVLTSCDGGVVGWVVERAEAIVESVGAATLLRPASLLSVRERQRLATRAGAAT